MARELKEGYEKFPPASRCLVQTIFPTECAAGLLEGLLPALRRQAAAVILSCRSRRLLDSEEPAGAEGEGPGCERRFFSRVHGEDKHLSGDE